MDSSAGPRSEGGAHPTLAGNMYDPNVNADGHMASGQGVGGTSEGTVRQEGAEHLRTTGGGVDSGMPSSSEREIHDEGIEHIKGQMGGTSGSGGVVPGEQAQSGGMLGSMKNYLGFGGSSAAPADARNAEGYETSASGFGGSSTAGDRIGGESYENSSSGLGGSNTGDRVGGLSGSEGGVGEAGMMAGGAASTRGATDATDNATDMPATTSATDPMKESSANTATPRDSDVTTGGDPTESADPTTGDRAKTGEEQQAEGVEEGHLAEHENKLSDRETGSSRQNEDAIPTAGGEKLGSKHWGESKVVPDNPKPQDSEAGVSSHDGQPTDQVRDNTKANTGGAAPPGEAASSGSSEKEGLVDKMKQKLHMGK
ncbi:hypothetical protein B0A55_00038 [Friedmanniomyces simplex]|uniref:Uncharacterized protein n=1 Tax=Friedmanniomyces simplex TaxID=329884 RepID=A0A4U0Y4G5_9PEZI|nr:hypothetical protein B0A55_00038 [Friedmanniomyces simplex]